MEGTTDSAQSETRAPDAPPHAEWEDAGTGGSEAPGPETERKRLRLPRWSVGSGPILRAVTKGVIALALIMFVAVMAHLKRIRDPLIKALPAYLILSFNIFLILD